MHGIIHGPRLAPHLGATAIPIHAVIILVAWRVLRTLTRNQSPPYFSVPIFLPKPSPMPITGPHALTPITQAEFAELDYQVMRLAFESQAEPKTSCLDY